MNPEGFSFHTETSIILLNITRGFNHGDTIIDTIIDTIMDIIMDTIMDTTRIPVVETTGYVEIQFNNYKHIELF